MALNVLQLSQVKRDSRIRRYALVCAECFLGGMIGALGALALLGWFL